MKTLSLFALAASLGMGAASLLHTKDHFPTPNQTVAQTIDGAFRDGVYLGRLAAQDGAAPHVAVGRWADSQDRASFTAGYRQGYSEFLASRSDARGRQAE